MKRQEPYHNSFRDPSRIEINSTLERSITKRINEKVDQLHQDPERYVEKLVRYPYYGIRVGDYRVISMFSMNWSGS